jgi:hypothetical protein
MMRFAPLLRLDVRHAYHGDGPAPIAFEPDAATWRLGTRPDLRIRLGAGVAEVFAADDRSGLAALAEDGLAFGFRLRPRDPAIAAVTAAVAGARGRLAVVELREGVAEVTVAEGDLQPLVASEVITPADVARPPLAILRLVVGAEARDLAFTLRFGALARVWTYHVIGGAAEAAYGIRDRERALTFEALGPRTMSNGARAQSFRSSAPIDERARPVGRFELVAEGPFGPRVVMANLPCPRPGQGFPDPGGGAASEIFVNLCQ